VHKEKDGCHVHSSLFQYLVEQASYFLGCPGPLGEGC